MQGLFRRADRWLMLNHPRLWAVQPHVALALALPVYVVTAIGIAIMRFALTPTARNISDSYYESIYTYINNVPYGLADQFIDSQVLSWSIETQLAQITQAFVLATVAALISSVATSVFWLQRCAVRSVEAQFGRSRSSAVWTEVVTTLVCTLILGGPVAWIALLISPTTTQLAARATLDELSRAEVRRLAAEKNHNYSRYVHADGRIQWHHLEELSNEPQDWDGYQVKTLRPDNIDLDTTYTRTIRSDNYGLHLQIQAKTAEASAYLDTAVNAAYTFAFDRLGGLSTFVFEICRNVLWPFSAGLTCLFVFLLKRAPMRYVATTFLIGLVVLPFATSLLNAIGTVILFAFTSTSGAMSSIDEWTLIYSLTVATSFAYGVQLVILIAIALIGQRAAVRKRWHLLATLAIPFAIAHGIWLLLIALALQTIKTSSDPDFGEVVMRQLLVAATLLPFYWLVIMPLLDKSLRRLMALPTE